MITLATAHPAKFPDAVKAATGIEPDLPGQVASKLEGDERYDVLPNDYEAVAKFIESHAGVVEEVVQ